MVHVVGVVYARSPLYLTLKLKSAATLEWAEWQCPLNMFPLRILPYNMYNHLIIILRKVSNVIKSDFVVVSVCVCVCVCVPIIYMYAYSL